MSITSIRLAISNYTARYLIADSVIYILRVWYNKENEKKL